MTSVTSHSQLVIGGHSNNFSQSRRSSRPSRLAVSRAESSCKVVAARDGDRPRARCLRPRAMSSFDQSRGTRFGAGAAGLATSPSAGSSSAVPWPGQDDAWAPSRTSLIRASFATHTLEQS